MENKQFEKTIIFCVLGDTVSSDFLRLWTEIVGYCLMNKIKPVLSTAKTTMFNSKMGVLSANSELNAPFGGKQDYDYIIYLKNSCLLTVNMIVNMIEQELDILSCLTSNERSLKHTNYIEKFDLNLTNDSSQEYCKFDEIQELMNKLQQYESSIRDASGNLKENIENIEKPSSLVKVNHIDFSVVCIKKGVFEKLKFPWFNYESSVNDVTGDVYFCNKCKEANIDIYVDVSLLVNCEKNVIC